MPSYHAPLDAERFEIRLIKLHSGQHGSIIKCSILHQSLLQPPSYTALSYRCGDPNVRTGILIDDTPVDVTVNLESALQRLRQRGVELVWADAICINQDDIQEKSHQLRTIRYVYEKSNCTYAWLGELDDDRAAQAICLLQDMLGQAEAQFPELHLQIRSDLGRLEERGSTRREYDARLMSSLPPRWVDRQSDIFQLDTKFDTLLDLLERQYWTRRWIIQEIAVAVRVDVLCGSHAISLKAMEVLLVACQKSLRWKMKHHTSFNRLRRILEFRRDYQASTPISLCKVLSEAQDFSSQDPRDSVFALMGICNDGQELVPMPSYHQHPDVVSCDLSRALLRKLACFDLILLANHLESDPDTLPTWSPNWLCASRILPEVFTLTHNSVPIDRSLIVDGLRGDTNILRVKGVMLGMVADMTSTLGGNSVTRPIPLQSQKDSISTASRTSTQYYQGRRCLKQAIHSCLLVTNNIQARDYHGERLHQQYLLQQFSFQSGTTGAGGRIVDSCIKMHRRCARVNGAFIIDNRRLGSWLEHSSFNFWMWVVWQTWFGTFLQALVILSSIGLGIFVIQTGHLSGMAIPLVVMTMYVIVRLLYSTMSKRELKVDEPREYNPELERPRRLIVLDQGIVGTACSNVAVGDAICLLTGCQKAAVLRPSNGDDGTTRYRVVGQASLVLHDIDYRKYELLTRSDERKREEARRPLRTARAEPSGWQVFQLI